MSSTLLTGAGLHKAVASGGGGYSAEAVQYFARITDPGTTRKDKYAAIIDATVAAGVWSKLDALWIYAADTQTNSLVNLKSSSYATAVVGAFVGMTFTADQGYISTASTDYLNTNFNASTAGGVYTQNSAHYSVWTRSTTVTNTTTAIMGNGASGVGETHIFPNYSGTDFYGRINAAADSAQFGTVPARNGHYIVNRSSVSATQGYKNGSAIGAGITNTSGALINATFLVCKTQGGNSMNDEIAAASIGGSLTSTEAAALYAALNTNKWW